MQVNKIISLTKAFIKEYYQSLPIFDTSNKKFNKKSVFYWLLIIIFFGVSYLSYEIIKFLGDYGLKTVFINVYLPIVVMFLSFQAILTCANIFFFSKDIENVLHMPIKPEELAISKLGTLLCMLYFSEAIISIVPLTIYGLMSNVSIFYFFWMIISIILIPIVIATIISIVVFIIMRLSKFIKNKEFFQIVITTILVAVIFVVLAFATKNIFEINSSEEAIGEIVDFQDKIQNVNKMFLIVNPTIKMLTSFSFIESFILFFKICAICVAVLSIFLIFCRMTYIKDILKNMISSEKKRVKTSGSKINKKIKTNNIAKTYILKEFKLLFRNSNFFMQCIFPVISLLISGIIIIAEIYPLILEAMNDSQIKQAFDNIVFNTEIACDILIVLQVLFTISNISLTAISREGKNAYFIKYIPVELYKQFRYKVFPQIVLNLLITIVVLGIILYIFPGISFINITLIFLISICINFINSYLMMIVDLFRPNLDWKVEAAVVKKSDNKLFQYAFMISNILILLYIATVSKSINIVNALVIEFLIYALIFITIDRCVKKWQGKLFRKIN